MLSAAFAVNSGVRQCWMVESSVSISEYWSMPSWEIQVNIYHNTVRPSSPILKCWWFGYSLYTICLKPKALAMQGNPNPEFRILGFGIRNPRRRLQYPGLSWIPLHGATRRCSHPRCSAKLEFIVDFIYLGSVISNKDGSQRDINKVRPGKVWGIFSIT